VSTYYCWHCYGHNRRASGRCAYRGQEIAAPAETALSETLIWAARHPDPDVAIMAVRRLGVLGDPAAAGPVRDLIDDPPDPYVAAQALRSLVALSTIAALEPLLERLASDGPVLVRAAAREALARRT
jgi:HEAT repeat protein